MAASTTEDLVSIIGNSYFQPISDLFANLLRRLPELGINDIQTSATENGYAASICILSVVCFESYTMRVRYKNRQHSAADKKNALEFLHELYPWLPDIDRLKEVFILRDILAHNHLWEIEFSWNDDLDMIFHSAAKYDKSGDRKYRNHVNINKRITTTLGLNVVPIRVNRTDACKVLSTVWDGLLFLEKQNRDQCSISHLGVNFNGSRITFKEFIPVVASMC